MRGGQLPTKRRARIPLSLIISGAINVVVMMSALLAPILATHNPVAIDPQGTLAPPQPGHLLGTDEFGRDIFSRLLYGAQPSLIVAIGATALAAVIGISLGIVAGYSRGWVEQLVMRSVDTLLCFPPILLAMVVVGFLGRGIFNLILVIGVLYSTTFARLAYAVTLQVVRMDYISAAVSLGVGHVRMIVIHILPNIASLVIVQASLTLAASILLESGLSFLGLGVVPPTPSWGLMIGDARGYMTQSPTYVLFPSLAIALTVLTINTMGDSLRDLLDPRMRKLGSAL